MNVYAEALSLVAAVLDEAEDPKQFLQKSAPRVKVLYHHEEREVAAVMLKSPRAWESFVRDGAHGMKRFTDRVDADDQPDFAFAMRDLVTRPVPVPASGHWALKMPGGYAILGTGAEGVSCTKKRQIISWEQQLVDNPNMSPEQNQHWRTARRGL